MSIQAQRFLHAPDEPGTGVATFPVSASNEAGLLERQGPLVRDWIGYLMSKLVPGFFGLVSVPIFVRLLGVSEYGRLSVILPILMALGGAGCWLQQGILRFHPPSDQPAGESPFDRAIVLGTGLAVAALGLVLLPVLIVMHYPWSVCVIAEAYCAIQLIYTVSLTRLQAQLRPRAVLRNEALRAVTGFLLPVGLIIALGKKAFPLVILGLAFGYLLPMLFTSSRRLPALLNLRHSLARRSNSESRNILGQLWRFGWAVGVWLMLCQALPVVGRSAIERYAGYAQAGIYASLYEIAVRSFSLFASPVMQAAHPRIMRSWNVGNYRAARATIRQAIRIQTLMFLPAEAIGVIFAGPLTRLIVGSGNSTPNSLLPLLMLGGFLWQIALLVHKPLEIMQRTKTMLCGMLGVLAIEFAGNYFLVPRFGMQSAVHVFVFGAVAYVVFAAGCGGVSLRQPDDQETGLS
jgi:O-antigen/teichoic acid export membrane protein